MSASDVRDFFIALGFALLWLCAAAFTYGRWDRVIEWNGWLRRRAEGTRFERFGFLLGGKQGAWGWGQIARITTAALYLAMGLMFFGFALSVVL